MLTEKHRRELVRSYGLGFQKGAGWPAVGPDLQREMEAAANDVLARNGDAVIGTILVEDLFWASMEMSRIGEEDGSDIQYQKQLASQWRE